MNNVLNALKPELDKLGLNYELIPGKEENASNYHLSITCTGKKYFEITVYGRVWNKPGMASIHFKDTHTEYTQNGTYSDNSPRWDSSRYEYENYLTMHEDKDLELIKLDYRHRIRHWSKNFKGTKSAKLIVNDCIPLIQKYMRVIDVVTPKLDAHLNKEVNTLALQNKIAPLAEYYHGEITSLSDQHFTIKDIGQIKISSYGDITLTKQLDQAELLKLVGLEK